MALSRSKFNYNIKLYEWIFNQKNPIDGVGWMFLELANRWRWFNDKFSRQNCDVVTFMMVTAATAASENGSLCPRERALVERWLKLTLRASIKLLNSWINCCGQKWNRNEKKTKKQKTVESIVQFHWNRNESDDFVEEFFLEIVLKLEKSWIGHFEFCPLASMASQINF